MVTSNAVFNELAKYNAISIGYTNASPGDFEIENLFPNSAIETNVYLITGRNNETHILTCATTDGGNATIPVWYLLYRGTGKLANITYDLDNKKIRLRQAGYSQLYITQIGGVKNKKINFSNVSNLFPNGATKYEIQYS